MLNLDTHIVIFALSGSLRPRERDLLRRQPWTISAIVLWELAKLFQLGRITLSLHDPEVASALSRIPVWPIDLDVCRALDRIDVHGDPADELIAATSLVHRVPLLTRDRRLLRSRVVPLA